MSSKIPFIPYARQSVSTEDIEAVVRVLGSDWLTQGPEVPRFEQAIAGYCGLDHVVAVSSGTAALHIAMLAAGLGPGKRLWTSPNSFVASANCGLYCGADIDFVDIDPTDANISIPALAQKLADAERGGYLPDVVIPVHFAGQPCNMAAIAELAKRYGFIVVEDASHALGASFSGHRIGDCNYSSMVVFSFHPVKIVTSGEGGAVTTKSPELAAKLRRLRTHGITREPPDGENDEPWRYWQIDLGFNYRVTDIQAALGANQMLRVDEFVKRRNELANRYDECFAGSAVRPLARRPYAHSSFHLYVVQVPSSRRRAVFDGLADAGIKAQIHYIPIHTQPYFKALGFKRGDFPISEEYYETTLSLPMFPTLSDDEQSRVVEEVLQLIQ